MRKKNGPTECGLNTMTTSQYSNRRRRIESANTLILALW